MPAPYESLLEAELGSVKQYTYSQAAYTAIGPLPRGWYEVLFDEADAYMSKQGASTIAASATDATSWPMDQGSMDRFYVSYDGTDQLGGPDDRYFAVKRKTGSGSVTLRIRARRAHEVLP